MTVCKNMMATGITMLFCLLLTIGCASSPAQSPVPAGFTPTPASMQRQDVTAEIAENLQALAGKKATLSYPIGPTLKEKMKLKEIQIDITPTLELLFTQPIYEVDAHVDTKYGGIYISVYLDAKPYEHEYDHFMALTPDSVRINIDSKHYVSYSKELYDAIFNMTNMRAYHPESLKNVRSITFTKRKNGKIDTINVSDEQTIKKITALLAGAELCSYKYDEAFEKIDVEMALHTDEGDVACHFESAPEYSSDDILQVNRFYCYSSKELLSYLRSLIK